MNPVNHRVKKTAVLIAFLLFLSNEAACVRPLRRSTTPSVEAPSGTSAGSGGPTGVGADITDGTAHWAFLDNTIAIDNFHLAQYDTSRSTVVRSAGSV